MLGDLLETGHKVLAALRLRSASESPWDAMQNALHVIAEDSSYNPEDGLKLAQMMLNTPSLRTRAVEKRLDWLDLLVPELDRRMGGASAPAGTCDRRVRLDVSGHSGRNMGRPKWCRRPQRDP